MVQNPNKSHTCKIRERIHLHPQSPWWGEHRSRYRFALPHCDSARVLDIACGTGFGVAMLEEAGARLVVGVDLSPATVSEAGSDYAGPGRCFLAADGVRLPFASATFELIVSFETLEHISASGLFLAELRRVLRSDGMLLLSTPNRDYTEMNGQTCVNPFHLREYTYNELAHLLSETFSRVELLGQRISAKYPISPFYSDHVRLRLTPMTRLRLFWWKVQNRLPFPIKDYFSRLVCARPFYPDEEHYHFTREGIEQAPVLVAICRP